MVKTKDFAKESIIPTGAFEEFFRELFAAMLPRSKERHSKNFENAPVVETASLPRSRVY